VTTRSALVTGGSSGIGAATARALAHAGFDVVVAARHEPLLRDVATEIGGRALVVDVTDDDSVAAMAVELGACSLLVHCAGGARGLDPVAEARHDEWRWMYEANVLGVVRVTQGVLPLLLREPDPHVVVISSISAFATYPGGGGYTAAKHAAHAVTETLRAELVDHGVRVTEIAPGLTRTAFAERRMRGDAAAAAETYRGVEALEATDVADCIAWAATRSPRVNVDLVVLKPQAQLSVRDIRRR
jgi:NADP-dependent 3-hydroxy acid dehydrogenase YdfG